MDGRKSRAVLRTVAIVTIASGITSISGTSASAVTDREIQEATVLMQSGSLILRKSGGLVSNTPLIGSEETITAYSLLEARHLTEALEIAKDCSVLNYGSTIEVRPILRSE
jgi:hypothetical protein